MKKALLAACVTAALAAPFGGASAQKYKDVDVPDNIDVIVAFSAGGSTDLLARTTAPYLEAAIEKLTGERPQIVVKNLPGAGGEVGWTALAREQDGGTIGIINLPAVAIVQAARDPAYAPWTETFVPIGVDVIDPNIVRVNGANYQTVEEAIAAAKEEPGSVTLGADGPLSDDQLAVYTLQAATGSEFAFIPYNGGAPANRAFLAEEVDAAMGNVTDYLQTEDKATDAVILAEERYPLAPDVPTAKEALGIDVVAGGSTRGWAVPASAPDELVKVYREAFAMAANNPEYQAEAKKRNLTLVEPKVGEKFGAIMASTQKSVDDLLKYFKQGGYLE